MDGGSVHMTIRQLRTAVVLAALGAGAAPVPADGGRIECPMPPPPCAAMRQASLVFVADVVAASSGTERINERGSRVVPYRVRFRIVEAFKGLDKTQTELDAQTDHNVEAPQFHTGRRYLVYARGAIDGVLVTTCTRSRRIDSPGRSEQRLIDSELRALRGCRRNAGGRV
jgi:hypothetical protein